MKEFISNRDLSSFESFVNASSDFRYSIFFTLLYNVNCVSIYSSVISPTNNLRISITFGYNCLRLSGRDW